MRNGRPKKQEDQIRNIGKNIRYSKEEWEIVQEKLKETGLGYSEFIRRASLNVEIKSIDSEVVKAIRDVQSNLKKIGNNINIIAKNSAMVTTAEEYDRHLSDLQKCKDLAKELSAELIALKDSMR